jgi:hypothetical protein
MRAAWCRRCLARRLKLTASVASYLRVTPSRNPRQSRGSWVFIHEWRCRMMGSDAHQKESVSDWRDRDRCPCMPREFKSFLSTESDHSILPHRQTPSGTSGDLRITDAHVDRSRDVAVCINAAARWTLLMSSSFQWRKRTI